MKKRISWLFSISLIGFGIGYLLTNSIKFGFCLADGQVTDASCINFYERIGDPLFYGMGALAFVFLILLALPRAFSWWWRFAVWFVPLAAIIFVIAPQPQGWISPIPAPEAVFKWISSFYIIVSASIITLHTIFGKKNQ